MFIVLLTYKKPLEIVEQFLAAHREFLNKGYTKNFLIASGPQNPRKGGVLLSQIQDLTVLKNFLQDDPFLINEIASYEFIEFTPVKYHPDFAIFVETSNI